MGRQTSLAVTLAVALAAPFASAQSLPLEPNHDYGQSITGAFEGWFPNSDGSFRMLVGYYNRSQKVSIDIPVGPDNRIEPGGPDYGQPTHFLPGRQWGWFTVRVPKDFGEKQLTWTITANGKSTQIPLNLKPLWEVSPFVDANHNTPPYMAFSVAGPFFNGPRTEQQRMTASVGVPLKLDLWATDDEMVDPGTRKPATPPVTLMWSKFRGPGEVRFSDAKPNVEKTPLDAAPKSAAFTGKSTTSATFSAPGDYTLHVVANDWSGDGGRGFECCWSTTQVRVTVK